jgi:hypothetical protein
MSSIAKRNLSARAPVEQGRRSPASSQHVSALWPLRCFSASRPSCGRSNSLAVQLAQRLPSQASWTRSVLRASSSKSAMTAVGAVLAGGMAAWRHFAASVQLSMHRPATCDWQAQSWVCGRSSPTHARWCAQPRPLILASFHRKCKADLCCGLTAGLRAHNGFSGRLPHQTECHFHANRGECVRCAQLCHVFCILVLHFFAL